MVIEHHRPTQQEAGGKTAQLRQRNSHPTHRSPSQAARESDHPLAPPFILGQHLRWRPVTPLRHKDIVGFLDVSTSDQLQQRGCEHGLAAGSEVRQNILHAPSRRRAGRLPFLVIEIAAEPQHLHAFSTKRLDSHACPPDFIDI